MQHPYTPAPQAAFAIAQVAIGALLGATMMRRRLLPARPQALVLASCALAIAAPFTALATWLLDVAASLLVVALLDARRRMLAGMFAAFGAIAVGLHHVFVDAAFVFGAVQLALGGALAGLLARAAPASDDRPAPAPLPSRAQTRVFVAATTLGVIGTALAFDQRCVIDDEWAYTFQAELFAHLRAYADVPACAENLENGWVFFWQGRAFSQFTPGWPLFLAPFVRLGVAWLANPVALGLLATGAGRLARRLVPEHAAAPACFLAAAFVAVSPSVLLNAASRFAHVFETAAFAWALEAACVVLLDRPAMRRAVGWSLVLGVALAWMIATRVPDGVALGSGIMLVVMAAVARRQLPLRALAPAAASFIACALITLVILRVQIGAWFRTGYSLTPELRPWAELRWSAPTVEELEVALPLGAGSYCFFPASLALGLAGLLAARGPARRLASMLLVGTGALLATYFFVEFGRLQYWAHGPRYQLPAVLALAVGSAAWLAPHLRRGPSLAVSVVTAAMTVALVGIAWPILRLAHDEAHTRTATLRAIERDHLHHAVVWVSDVDVATNPSSLTQNSPVVEPDVVVAIRHRLGEDACMKARYPDRTFYRAIGKREVAFIAE